MRAFGNTLGVAILAFAFLQGDSNTSGAFHKQLSQDLGNVAELNDIAVITTGIQTAFENAAKAEYVATLKPQIESLADDDVEGLKRTLVDYSRKVSK